MPAVDHQRVARSFHRGAAEYDQHTPVQQRVVQRLLERLAGLLPVEPGRVLDIGCGTGQLLAQVARRYPQASLTGLDLAPNMLRQAGQRLGKTVILQQGDAEHLPFGEHCFDLVVSSSTFQWLEQCSRCFSEVHRVLESGGLFGFALFGAGTLAELRVAWQEALERCDRHLPLNQDGSHRFPTVDTIRDALVEQGFYEVSVTSELEQVWYPDLPQLLQAIKRIGAGTARPPAGGGLGWRRVLHEMAAIYRERFGTDRGVPASYHVIYGSGRL